MPGSPQPTKVTTVNRRARQALTQRDGDTARHLAVLNQARDTNLRLRRAERTIDLLETERRRLFRLSRDLDPPLTYGRVADACGISESAVMQVVAKSFAQSDMDDPPG